MNELLSGSTKRQKTVHLHSLEAVSHLVPGVVDHLVQVLEGVDLQRRLRLLQVGYEGLGRGLALHGALHF